MLEKSIPLDQYYGPARTNITTVDPFERELTVSQPVLEQGQLRLRIKSRTRTIFVNVRSEVIYPTQATLNGRQLTAGYFVAAPGPRPRHCYYCFRHKGGWYRPFLPDPSVHVSKVRGKLLKRLPWKPYDGPIQIGAKKGLLAYRVRHGGHGIRDLILRPVRGFGLRSGRGGKNTSEQIRLSLMGVKKTINVTLWRNR